MATQPRILIIEDETTLLEMYKLKFEASGFTFFGATTGEEGVDVAKQEKPDLMMVDLMLANKPDGGVMDGYEAIRRLRKDAATKNKKICALTNFDQEKNVQDARAAGADDYLVKSDLTPAELVNKAKDILAGKKVGLTNGNS